MSTEHQSPAIEILSCLLAGWRRIALGALCVATVSVGTALLVPSRWVASGVMRPKSAAMNLGSVGGLAADLGLSLGSAAGGPPAQYFVSLGTSSAVVGAALRSFEAGARGGERDRLLAALGFRGSDLEMGSDTLIERAVRRVLGRYQIRADAATGTLVFSVSLTERALALSLLNRLMQELRVTAREIQRAEGEEIEGALEPLVARARDTLSAREVALRDFLVANRAGLQYPAVSLEADRLRSAVEIAKSTYLALQESLAEAAIARAKELSPLSIVEPPSVPVEPEGRRLLLWTIVGLIVGALGMSVLQIWGASGQIPGLVELGDMRKVG